MIDFLLKSTICLSVFLGFYHLVLEREKIHQFNRFYLLFTIAISLVVPFLTFEIIKIVPIVQTYEPLNTAITSAAIPENEIHENYLPIEENTNFIPYILWSLYAIISVLLSVRFGKNIFKLISKTKANPNVKYENANLVLVEEKTLPHTFWNSIFINFDDYNQRNIEDELYTHELVHVTQRHTFDILFIETLKTIFWFNPLFYFYKKAIQLNHEFLADEGVVNSCDDVPFYQSLLLQKNSINHVFLTSNLNYLVTKKRLIMMTKSTSQKLAILKKVAILPIIAGLIYFFCVEIVAQEKPVKANEATVHVTSEMPKNKSISQDNYFKGVRIKYYEKLIERKEGVEFSNVIFDKKYEELTASEKKEIEMDLILILGASKSIAKKSPSQYELDEFKNSKKFAIWIDGKNVPNNELNKFNPKDFAYYSGSVILKNSRTKKHPQPFQYWFYTYPYYKKTNMGKNENRYNGEEIVIYKDGKNHIITPTKKSAIKAEVVSSNESEKIAVGKEADLKEPSFPSGISEFYNYFAKNFKMPANFKSKDKLIASFIVEKDGSLSNIEIKKDLGFGTKEETIRVLENSPKWIPATKDNEKIRYQYVLPILISSE